MPVMFHYMTREAHRTGPCCPSLSDVSAGTAGPGFDAGGPFRHRNTCLMSPESLSCMQQIIVVEGAHVSSGYHHKTGGQDVRFPETAADCWCAGSEGYRGSRNGQDPA